MSAKGRLPSFIRILRLLAALSLMIAFAAIVTIFNGDPAAEGRILIGASVALGSLVLIGMALLLFAYRQKDKNDPRP